MLCSVLAVQLQECGLHDAGTTGHVRPRPQGEQTDAYDVLVSLRLSARQLNVTSHKFIPTDLHETAVDGGAACQLQDSLVGRPALLGLRQ